jgi:hypothetical protein
LNILQTHGGQSSSDQPVDEDVAEVVIEVCRALTNLSVQHDTFADILALELPGFIPCMIDLLHKHQTNAKVMDMLSWTLSNLASDGEHIRKQLNAIETLPSLLIEILRLHLQDKEVCLGVCTLIFHLISKSLERQGEREGDSSVKFASTPHFAETLYAVLQTHGQQGNTTTTEEKEEEEEEEEDASLSVIIEAVRIMQYLSFQDTLPFARQLATTIAPGSCCSLLVQLLSRYREHEEAVKLLCPLLSNLCVESESFCRQFPVSASASATARGDAYATASASALGDADNTDGCALLLDLLTIHQDQERGANVINGVCMVLAELR